MWGEITRKLHDNDGAYEPSEVADNNILEIDDEPFEPDFDFDAD